MAAVYDEQEQGISEEQGISFDSENGDDQGDLATQETGVAPGEDGQATIPEGPEQFREASGGGDGTPSDADGGGDTPADADTADQQEENQDQQDPLNSGLNDYLDDSGTLIGGITRLGSLGTDYWEMLREREEELREEEMEDAAEAFQPGDTPRIDPVTYDARGILYAHDVDPGNFADHSLYVRVLDHANLRRSASEVSIDYCECAGGTDPRALVNGPLVELATDGNGLPIVDANGYVSFSLTQAALDYFDRYPAETYVEVFYTVTVVENGVSKQYKLQIVIPKDETFDSAQFDQGSNRGTLGPDGLIHGEWHSGTGHSACSGYTTTSSNMNDELYFEGDLENVSIHGGYAADQTQWGADTVLVNGSLDASGGSSEILMTGLDGADRSTVIIGADRNGAASVATAVSAVAGGAAKVEASGDITVKATGTGVLADDAGGTGDESNTLVSGGSIFVAVSGENEDLLGVGATGSKGFNTLRAEDSVLVAVDGAGNATGIDGGQTSVTAEESVEVNASGAKSATGVRAEGGDAVSLGTDSGNVTVAAESENGTATGLDATAEGASITVDAGANVAVTATAGDSSAPTGAGDAWAVRHNGGDIAISGDDVTLGAVSHTGGANGLHGTASSGQAALTASGKVTVSAETTKEGSDAYGVYYEGAQGNATITAAEAAISAASVTGTARALDGATVDSAKVTATAEAKGNGLAVAIGGAVDRTFIQNADSVTGTATSGGSAYGNEGAHIKTNDSGTIKLSATAGGEAVNTDAYGNYQGDLTADNGVITVSGANTGTGSANDAYGSLNGALAAQKVTASADSVNGTAYAIGSTGSATSSVIAETAVVKAMSSAGNAFGTHGAVILNATDEATVTANGAGTTWAVYGDGGETDVKAKTLTVNATGKGAATGGMSLTGATIEADTVGVTVIGNTSSGTATGIRVTEETATIDAGTLGVTVTGSAATGLATSGAAADIGADAVTLDVKGTATATGMAAGTAGTNTVDAGTITVDVAGVTAATGLNAAGSGAKNTLDAAN
ncbi:MAG: hypothetical protein LIP28_00580 [Deltaproteobacteria bacterium]|nr:hypothetical protein [Deltaproteobacteria bacterium]